MLEHHFLGLVTVLTFQVYQGGESVLMHCLIQEPNVLFLDEPTNDLDIDTLTVLGGLFSPI